MKSLGVAALAMLGVAGSASAAECGCHVHHRHVVHHAPVRVVERIVENRTYVEPVEYREAAPRIEYEGSYAPPPPVYGPPPRPYWGPRWGSSHGPYWGHPWHHGWGWRRGY